MPLNCNCSSNWKLVYDTWNMLWVNMHIHSQKYQRLMKCLKFSEHINTFMCECVLYGGNASLTLLNFCLLTLCPNKVFWWCYNTVKLQNVLQG